jgi:hypothetical protein
MSPIVRGASNLLFDEPPLVISPTLAAVVGLSEAIILQQLHYWLRQAGKERDGRLWIYNTYDTWQEQFPFWSVPTIKRTILDLQRRGLILTDAFNKARMDRTKWYSLDYDALDRTLSSTRSDHSDPIE